MTGDTGAGESAFRSAPFGESYSFIGNDDDHTHFAGLERDDVSATDHAQFRQYASLLGRWHSPDPYSGSYDSSNPQSFNRYSYALNSPLSFRDPSGLVPCGYGEDDYEEADDNAECTNNGGTVQTQPGESVDVNSGDGGGGDVGVVSGTVGGQVGQNASGSGSGAPNNLTQPSLQAVKRQYCMRSMRSSGQI